jgi:hypothetical protein
VLLQKVLESLISEFLALAAPSRDGVDRLPGLVIELHAFPGHLDSSECRSIGVGSWIGLAPV